MGDQPNPSGTQGIITDALILSGTFHPRYGVQILTQFQSDWLSTPETKEIFHEAQSFYHKFRTVPNAATLIEFIRLEGQHNSERLSQFQNLVLTLPQIENPEFFEYQLEKKLQGKALYQAIRNAAMLIQDDKYEEIFELFQKARLKTISTHESVGSFWDDWGLRDVTLKGVPIPTGFSAMDNLLRGGIYPGELMLTIGLKSTGKSFFAVWVARSGLFVGRTIVVFTMEMSRSDLLKRIDCSIANFDFDVYHEHREEVRDIIMSKKDQLLGDIQVIEFPSGYPTVQTLENSLLETEQRIGKKVDGFVVDYIDLMRGTVVGSKGDARFGLISTAVELRGLCGKYNYSGIVLTQSNALGKKKTFIESENAAEAYGQSWAADFVISINEVVGRPDQRRLYIADSRRTLKKVSFLYHVDFSRAQWSEQSGF